MRDRFQREISYLRISITDKCNLRCTYCMGEEGQVPECRQMLLEGELSPLECREIARAAAALGIRKIRITGGEPLVRPDVAEICAYIHQIEGIEELTLTTNGIFLETYAQELQQAGVGRVNISLDTLNEEKYHRITRKGNIQAVLRGIEEAKRVGLLPIKINVVLLKDFNEDEIEAFVRLTRQEPVEVRFIELMPIGAGKEQTLGSFLPGETVLSRVPELVPVEDSGVARLYRLPEGAGRVGLIRPVSRHFCPSCNRIRVTSDGKIKPCLHSREEINIRGLSGAALEKVMEEAIWNKPMEHVDFQEGQVSGSGRSMNQIGG